MSCLARSVLGLVTLLSFAQVSLANGQESDVESASNAALDTNTASTHSTAFKFFRSENDAVASGNERMSAEDAAGALAAYDEAAKALPNDAGVHFNRGLALMAQGQLDKAAPAFQLATQPPADKGLRSQAYYNLGNAFFKQADALAKEEKPDEAQKGFREAADAYKQSLRLNPGQADAAWNLQLASRRLREEEEKQKQKDEEKQKQDEQNQDQDQNQDGQEKNEQGEGEPQDQDPDQNPGQEGQDKKNEPKPEPDQKKKPEPKPEQSQQDPEKLPSDAKRALDALQDGEENLQKHQAQQRAGGQRRRPEKDW